MTSIKDQILALEESLRQAELGPDPSWFEKHLDDDMVFVADGKVACPKPMIVEAHRPNSGKGQKFTSVEMSNLNITEQGPAAAVVTCTGRYESDQGTHVLNYLRVWVKKGDTWTVVAASMF